MPFSTIGRKNIPLLNQIILWPRRSWRGLQCRHTWILAFKAPWIHTPTKQAIHMAAPISYSDGTVANLPKDGDVPSDVGFIFPENLVKSVAQIMGADPAKFRSVPATVKSIPGLAR